MKLDKTLRAYGAELVKRYREKAGKRGAPARTIPVRGSAHAPQAIGTRAKRVDAITRDLTPELEAAFERRGLSAESARVAARGRAPRSSGGSLIEAGQRLGLMPAAAHTFARGRSGISEAVTKHEDPNGAFKGGEFPPADYAYVPDREDPSTWALLLTLVPGGMPDPDSVKAAVHAIDPVNPAPCPVPADAIADVKKALVNAWTKAGLPADSLPEILTTEALRRSFRRLGLSETAAAVAASGRGRRL